MKSSAIYSSTTKKLTHESKVLQYYQLLFDQVEFYFNFSVLYLSADNSNIFATLVKLIFA